MDFGESFNCAVQIVRLKESAMKEVASNKEALRTAILFVILGAVAGSLGGYLFSSSFYGGMVLYRLSVGDFLGQAIMNGVTALFFLFLAGYLGEHILGAKLNTNDYVKVGGHAALLQVLSVIPFLAPFASIWSLIVFFAVWMKLGKLSLLQTVLLLILSAVAASVLAGVLGFLGLEGSYFAGMGLGTHSFGY